MDALRSFRPPHMGSVPVPEIPTAAVLVGGLLALVAGAGIAWTGTPLRDRGRMLGVLAATVCVGIGAALISLPWLARPVPAPAPAPLALVPEAVTLSAQAGRTVAAPVHALPPPLPGREATRITIEASEAEPNDTIAGANAAPLGASILGHAAEGDSDIFAFDTPDRKRGAIVASLTARDASVALVLYDDAGRSLGTARTIDEIRVRVATLERLLDGPRYYVQVIGLSATPVDYQLTVVAARR